MSLTVIDGLPAHILFVHAVIVLVPLAALTLVICAIWPSATRRLGLVLPVLGLVTLAFVPLTVDAGEWLEGHVPSDPLVKRHTDLGDSLLPWAVGLFVLSAALWWLARRATVAQDASAGSTWVTTAPIRVAAVVLSLVVAVGSVISVYRIGESGAKAAWHDGYSKTALHPADDS